MKVNNDNINTNFKGIYNNKYLKKGLEFAADNGALFAASTTLILSSTVRPLAILTTPKTDKKNKKIACAKSLTSSLNGYFITLLFSKPLSKSIKNIDKNPEKYLSKETIKNFKENKDLITESPAYKMATQLFKLGLGAIIAAPKAILTALGTPYILDIINSNAPQNGEKTNSLSFKGKDSLPKGISKILNKKWYQDFTKKNKDSNFPMHIIAATDTISTATFVNQLNKNNRLTKEEKKPLIYNSILSTALSIISTYIIDASTNKSTENLINKYKKVNHADKNLTKQIEGIKIAKPILIAGSIYYIIIPIISTFIADRIKITKNKN